MTTAIDGFTEGTFAFEDASFPLYRRGTGPGVIVVHEIPGITPEVARFARRVADDGFTVFMPMLFGTPGRPYSAAYDVSQIARSCIRREFAVLASNRSSPVVDAMRALCRAAHEELGGRGVGAVGMCITGNFALAMMVEPCVVAPVLSQPSLPFPLGHARKQALHVTPEALDAVRERTKREGLTVLGLRFTDDWMSPPERFRRLERELGSCFEGIEIDSSRHNPHGIARTAHSVLTRDLVDEEGHPTRAALDRVLAFFRERLKPVT